MARSRRTMSSSRRRPTRSPSFERATVVILSTINRLGSRMPPVGSSWWLLTDDTHSRQRVPCGCVRRSQIRPHWHDWNRRLVCLRPGVVGVSTSLRCCAGRCRLHIACAKKCFGVCRLQWLVRQCASRRFAVADAEGAAGGQTEAGVSTRAVWHRAGPRPDSFHPRYGILCSGRGLLRLAGVSSVASVCCQSTTRL
jgi:hypothetical protein